MKVYIVHSIARGKNDKTMVGIKIEKVFNKVEPAQEYSKTLLKGEHIISGELVELRVGITEAEVEGAKD